MPRVRASPIPKLTTLHITSAIRVISFWQVAELPVSNMLCWISPAIPRTITSRLLLSDCRQKIYSQSFWAIRESLMVWLPLPPYKMYRNSTRFFMVEVISPSMMRRELEYYESLAVPQKLGGTEALTLSMMVSQCMALLRRGCRRPSAVVALKVVWRELEPSQRQTLAWQMRLLRRSMPPQASLMLYSMSWEQLMELKLMSRVMIMKGRKDSSKMQSIQFLPFTRFLSSYQEPLRSSSPDLFRPCCWASLDSCWNISFLMQQNISSSSSKFSLYFSFTISVFSDWRRLLLSLESLPTSYISRPMSISFMTEGLRSLVLERLLGLMELAQQSSKLSLSLSLDSLQLLRMLEMQSRLWISLATSSLSTEDSKSNILSWVLKRLRSTRHMGMTKASIITIMTSPSMTCFLQASLKLLSMMPGMTVRLVVCPCTMLYSERIRRESQFMRLQTRQVSTANDTMAQRQVITSVEGLVQVTPLRMLGMVMFWSNLCLMLGQSRLEQLVQRAFNPRLNCLVMSANMMAAQVEYFLPLKKLLMREVLRMLLYFWQLRRSCRLRTALDCMISRRQRFMLSTMGLLAGEVLSQGRTGMRLKLRLSEMLQRRSAKKVTMIYLQMGTVLFSEKLEMMVMAELTPLVLEADDSCSQLIIISIFLISQSALLLMRLEVMLLILLFSSLHSCTWMGGALSCRHSLSRMRKEKGELMVISQLARFTIRLNFSHLIVRYSFHSYSISSRHFLMQLCFIISAGNPFSFYISSPYNVARASHFFYGVFLITERKVTPSLMSI